MTGKFDIHFLWERCACGADTIISLLVLQRQFAKWALRTSSWRPAHALDSFVDLPSAKRFPANN